MDKKEGFIWINGELIDWKNAKIHVLTHGLHYGSGAFEGIRSYNGKIFKAKEHFERLFRSAEVLKIDIQYSIEELIDISNNLLKTNNVPDAYIRPLIFKGPETTRLNGKCSDNIMIACWELKNYFDNEKFNQGIKVTFSDYIKPSKKYMPIDVKISGLYSMNLIVRNSIDSTKFDDAIMLDENNHVAECTTSNIFMVKDNILYTPIADCFLNGITRQTVINLAINHNIQIEEKKITKAEILQADEIFITGTAVEIMPITQINEKIFYTGEVTKKIIKLYRNEVNK
jgi:branched-chain amino acid aminotransferase